MNFLVLGVLCLTVFFQNAVRAEYASEARLMDILMRNYHKTIRPAGFNETMVIKFGLGLTSIVDFKYRGGGFGEITINTYDRYLWQDLRLVWDPAEFNGVTVKRVPVKEIWTPDITLFNSLDPDKDNFNTQYMALVYSTGDVLYIPHTQSRVKCEAQEDKEDAVWTCRFKFGSWAYDGFKITLDWYEGQEVMDLTDYDSMSDWSVTSAQGVSETNYYPCCMEPYPSISFYLKLEKGGGSMSDSIRDRILEKLNG